MVVPAPRLDEGKIKDEGDRWARIVRGAAPGERRMGEYATTREAAREIPRLQAQNFKVFRMIEVGHQRTLPGESEVLPLKGPAVAMHLNAPAPYAATTQRTDA